MGLGSRIEGRSSENFRGVQLSPWVIALMPILVELPSPSGSRVVEYILSNNDILSQSDVFL
jgi:hypothetical protein